MKHTMSYLDFDLLIEKSATGYWVKVINSPAGQASQVFVLPFSALELENFVLRLGQLRHGMRRTESPGMEAAKEFGGKLFNALFTDEVKSCWQSSLNDAARNHAGLRLRLRLSGAPELLDVPWEFLYHASLNRFLALSTETPLVRYLDLAGRIAAMPIHSPLRVLVMIASPRDYPTLDVAQEWQRLKAAVTALEQRGLLVLERLPLSTLGALQRQLRQNDYHIFHFIGHGGYDEQAQDGLLLLEDESGKSRPISGQYLGMILHDAKTLRLALLNCCEGGRTSATEPFAGVCQSLLQQGIPAVIAMQFAISDQAAITLTHEFYTALAEGLPVDTALAEARKSIFAENNDVEWGTPVLYMRTADGQLFALEVAASPASQRDLLAPKLPTAATLSAATRNHASVPVSSTAVASPAQHNRNIILSIAIAMVGLMIALIGGWPWIAEHIGTAAPALTAIHTVEPISTTAARKLPLTPRSALAPIASTVAPTAVTPLPTATNLLATPTSPVLSAVPEVANAASDFTSVFTHTFEDGHTNAWDDGASGEWQVVEDGPGNHVYQVHTADTSLYSASDPPEQALMTTWQDYALDLRLRILDPGATNNDLSSGWITIRADTSAQDCALYSFQINFQAQMMMMDTQDHCEYKLLAAQPFPLELMRWYNVRIEAVGTHIQLFIDGQVIIDHEDSTAKRGFYYLTADRNAILQFDDIRVGQYKP